LLAIYIALTRATAADLIKPIGVSK
jgi:hypothetical protein